MEKTVTYKVLHLFSGIGGGAFGFQHAHEEYKGIKGKFETICGIDSDPEACADFNALTRARVKQVDLFDRQQYIDFHGKQPPKEWEEVTPEKLRKIVGDIPDVVFTSPPCKGFSGLLSEKSSKTKKYQALNKLTLRSIWLTLDAFKDDLPALILLENVPRITTRGKYLLDEIKQQLKFYGYEVSDNYHDCGVIGGLAQHRKRYLLVARNPKKLDSFVYLPPERKMQTIGDVIGPLPMPDDIEKGGPMHRLPKLQWKTWVRLALIKAGGDWRDLENIDWEKYRIEYETRSGAGRIGEWNKPAGTITGAAFGRSNSMTAIADPRLTCKPRSGTFGVMKWDEPAKTVVGSQDVHAGAAAIADPRIPDDNEQGVFVIIAEDGTWHRPLTTFELAILQGFPTKMPEGQPFQLAGRSDARWRERIGNAVPPGTAQAIGETVLRSLLAQEYGDWLMAAETIWVTHKRREVEEIMVC